MPPQHLSPSPRPLVSPPRAKRRVAWCGQVAALLLCVAPGARADTQGAVLLLQANLGATLNAAAQATTAPPTNGAGTSRIVATGLDAACTEQPSTTPRLALVSGQPREADLEACRQKTASDVLAVTIGYQAVALVTPATGPVFSLSSADLFRAIAAHAELTPVPVAWRDVDPNLPALKLGLLAAPVGSASNRLLNTYVMEPACNQQDGARLPFDAAGRIAFCGTLRSDPAIVRRDDGPVLSDGTSADGAIAAWAAAAPAGQLAVVNLAEIRKYAGAVIPLPLDGVLPTAANVASGAYPAAEATTLVIVVPHDTPPGRRYAARRAVFELLSERSIGPDGNLAQAGLVPLAPTERVASRLRAVAFVESP